MPNLLSARPVDIYGCVFASIFGFTLREMFRDRDDDGEPPDQTDIVESSMQSQDVDSAQDYGMMTVAELKVILSERGMPTSGRKAELIERLKGA